MRSCGRFYGCWGGNTKITTFDGGHAECAINDSPAQNIGSHPPELDERLCWVTYNSWKGTQAHQMINSSQPRLLLRSQRGSYTSRIKCLSWRALFSRNKYARRERSVNIIASCCVQGPCKCIKQEMCVSSEA